MLRALTLTLALAAGVANAQPVACTRTDEAFSVKLVFMPQAKVREHCARLGAWGGVPPRGPGMYGCNAFDTVDKVLTIYATAPTTVDDAATLTLGHELMHGYCGRYHP